MFIEIVKGVKTEVEVRLKRVKYDSIRITNGPLEDRKIILTFNHRLSEREVINIINEKKAFIIKALNKDTRFKVSSLNENQVMLFGNIYNIVFGNEYNNVEFLNDTIYAKNKKALEEYAINILINRFKEIENKYSFPKTALYVHKMKSRWGVCYPKNAKIGLSKALIYVPFDCIDYVILHEFTHFKYANHSVYFHRELSKFCPNEKELSKKLKNYTEFLYL